MDVDAALQRHKPLRNVRVYDRDAATRALRGIRWPAAPLSAAAAPATSVETTPSSTALADLSHHHQQQTCIDPRSSSNSSCSPATADAGVTVECVRVSSSTKVQESQKLPNGQMVDLAESSQSAVVCTTCQLSFSAFQDQRLHFKSDFHLLNIKRKLKGLDPIDEDKFEDVTSDMSSLSGSDTSDSSDDTGSEYDGSSTVEDDVDDLTRDTAAVWTSSGGRLLLQNDDGEVLSLFKAVVCSKKRPRPSIDELRVAIESLPSENIWAVLLTGGGHFAGAIFESGTVVHHKTFHRYVVRAKRGTAQGAFDVKGAPAKSAGASLRRYNEQALTQDIRDLLQTWSPVLKTCHRIFIRVAGRNRRIFFDNSDGGACFQADDERIRVIPFQTRRPTFREAQRVFTQLSTIHCYPAADLSKTLSEMLVERRPKASRSADELTAPAAAASSASSSSIKRDGICEPVSEKSASGQKKLGNRKAAKLRPPAAANAAAAANDAAAAALGLQQQAAIDQQEKECAASRVPPAVLSACSSGDVDLLMAEIEKMTGSAAVAACIPASTAADASHSDCSTLGPSQPPASSVLNRPVAAGPHGRYCQLLHVAAALGHDSIVRLLLENGADPALRDEAGKTAFQVCTEKETRNEFRRFMARFPEKYDYVEAQIPGPLTEDMERERKEKEAARRKALKKTKKENLKAKKAVEKVQQDEERERTRYAQLSDREKRALAADRRFAEQLVRTGEQVPVLSRCWMCGKNMTGQVPFEYFDYKFCSTACLKSHRANSSTK